MRDIIFANWDFMRWLRLIIGGYFMYVAIVGGESVLGFLAAFFIFQALTNTGCGVNGCAPRPYSKTDIQSEDPDYEIIKPK
ncbi:MAG: alkaline shock response membrane anchor protein AmaP [Chitinophagales bacterium]|nr:alkaline shock response membrane anchor protein AmaP [Chitinophagales bacterium]